MEIGIEIDAELQQQAERRAAEAGYPSVSNWVSDLVTRELQQSPVEAALAEALETLQRDRKDDANAAAVRGEIEKFLGSLGNGRSGEADGAVRDHVMATYENSRRRFDSIYRRLAQ